MRHVLTTEAGQAIPEDRAFQVTSARLVEGIAGALADVRVVVDVAHTDLHDLTVKLVLPTGREVMLVDRDSLMWAHAQLAVRVPRSMLPELAEGLWVLKVQDRRSRDGGRLNWWRLELETSDTSFVIELDYKGVFTGAQRRAFEASAARWAEVITGDLPEAAINGRWIDDVLIYAEVRTIDGPGSVLGQAGPTHLRAGSMLPIAGAMTFDSADLARLERDGMLEAVILHEMAHVLGFGTIWGFKELLAGEGTDDPRFVGQYTVDEWLSSFLHLHVSVTDPSAGVPVANTGGGGTREAHWRESVFRNELMTGYINRGLNPLTRLTVASLRDLGYQVDINAADALAEMVSLMRVDRRLLHRCVVGRFEPVIVGQV